MHVLSLWLLVPDGRDGHRDWQAGEAEAQSLISALDQSSDNHTVELPPDSDEETNKGRICQVRKNKRNEDYLTARSYKKLESRLRCA